MRDRGLLSERERERERERVNASVSVAFYKYVEAYTLSLSLYPHFPHIRLQRRWSLEEHWKFEREREMEECSFNIQLRKLDSVLDGRVQSK